MTLEMPLPFRGGVGVGTVHAHRCSGYLPTFATPSPSPEGAGS
jgi:hypothetical protein